MAESRRTKMTKLLLRTALIELMQEKPFHKITVKEICERADLNRATFYLHYTDQNQLLDEVINSLVNGMTEYLSTYKGEYDRVTFLSRLLEYIKDNSELYRTLMSNDINGGTRDKIIRDVLGNIKNDLPVFGSSTENKYFYTYFIDGTASVILKWINSNFDLSCNELAKLIGRLHTDSRTKWNAV